MVAADRLRSLKGGKNHVTGLTLACRLMNSLPVPPAQIARSCSINKSRDGFAFPEKSNLTQHLLLAAKQHQRSSSCPGEDEIMLISVGESNPTHPLLILLLAGKSRLQGAFLRNKQPERERDIHHWRFSFVGWRKTTAQPWPSRPAVLLFFGFASL